MDEETKLARERTNKIYGKKYGVDIDELIMQYNIGLQLEKENRINNTKIPIDYSARDKLKELGIIGKKSSENDKEMAKTKREINKIKERMRNMEEKAKESEVQLSELSAEEKKILDDIEFTENLKENSDHLYHHHRVQLH